MPPQTISSDKLEKVSRDKTLAERAYLQVKKGLTTGVFRPGQKITGRLVADALDVSLTPAREAISRLIAEGALEAVGSRTICVPVLTPEKYKEITDIRLLVEGYAAERAASNLTPENLESLELIQLELTAALDSKDYKTTLLCNNDFHFTIYKACGLPKLVSFIESMWVQVGPLLNHLYPEYRVKRVGVQHHKEALSAARRGDGKALGSAIRADIQDGYTRMSKAIEKVS